MNKKVKKSKDKVRFLLKVIIAVLLLICLRTSYKICEENYKYRKYSMRVTEASYFDDYMRNYNYPNMVTETKKNAVLRENFNCNPVIDTTEYEAIAMYYEAAVYASMYKEDSNLEQAVKWSLIMDGYRSKLVSQNFIAAADEIDQKFFH